jgi:acyl carrier protein
MPENPVQRTAARHSSGAAEVTDTVNRVIRRYALVIPETVAITPDLGLVEAGVDSITLVEIIAGLEAEFGCTFPGDLITFETFQTPASIVSTVTSLIS